jgi:plasmid stabilization system protein ParE
MIHLSQAAADDVVRVREFLSAKNPEAAKRALAEIFAALQKVDVFPGLGKATEDPEVRQIVVPFGSAGYIVRYTVRPGSGNVLALRIWHGREVRI